MVSEIARTGFRGPAARTAAKPRRGLVLGCGGTLGGAWSIAALLEVARVLDWDPREADVIVGTSAGSELAMLLASGVSVQELVDAQLGAASAPPALARRFATPPPGYPPRPHARLGAPHLLFRRETPRLTALAGLLPVGRGDLGFLATLVDAYVPARGWVPHPATWIVAVDFDRGERVAFGSPAAPPAAMRDAVRASWAIPGWYPAVGIGGRRYVDGGVASPTSADLLVDERLDEVIVIAPMASTNAGPRRGLGRVEGVLRAAMGRALDGEVARLRSAGARVVRIEPGAEDLTAMGGNVMNPAPRLRVLETSLRTTRRTVRQALEQGGVTSVNEGANEAASCAV